MFFCVSARNYTSRENFFAQFPKQEDWNYVENKDDHHYHQYHHNYHQVMLTTRNVFIATLAVSDILLCSFCMPLTLVDILTNYWTLGQNMVWNWVKFKEVTKIAGDSLQVDRSDPVDVRLLLLLLDPAHRLRSLLLHRPPHWKSDLYQTGDNNKNMSQNYITLIRSRSNRQQQKHASKWCYFYQISIKQASTSWLIMIILQYFMWDGNFCQEIAKLSRIVIKNSIIFRNSSSLLRVWKETFNK